MRVYTARLAACILTLLCTQDQLYAQYDGDCTWYFGRNAAVSFSQSEVRAGQWLDSAYAGAGMFLDQNGRPMLFTGWRTVFNAASDTLGNCRYDNISAIQR